MINLLLQAILYQCLCEPLIVSSRIHGRYTKSLSDYHLSIPHKLAADGKFSTFHLPHFHDHRIERYKERRKRSSDDPEMIHYGVDVDGHLYHLELWPNREFIHPGLVFEKRDPEADIKQRSVRSLKGKKLCHYTGKVRGYPDSKAAISTCDGLAGYIVVEGNKYFIEPVDEHSPNFKGHHLHVVHNKVPRGTQPTCGTQESWEDAMKKRLRERALSGEDIFKEKRQSESINRYLEIGVVCDKSFLKYHKQRDVELYVLTIMNMVADYYHDASVGHQMDIVVVRVIYLEKEEKEIDLEINRDSGKTLKSFCNWANKINTPENTPNHFDMAMLLTRYDLCAAAEEDCDLTGLAFVGGACSKDEQCGINEDGGLVLSVIVAHEIGHLMGAEHDEQSTPCPVQDTDGSYFVMSPIVSTYTIRWSSCSRSLINALIQNNLAHCLSDIPESTLYPFTENMPGVVYDANEQCKFMLPASLGVCSAVKEKICENLICKVNKKECIGKNDVAADGTKCAENKWCFKKKCIEMGARPEAVNGGWGDFGPWSECTRTCGGGISSSERECNNPVPSNRGRFCMGERRKLKICNPGPCPENAPTFRQQQCTEQNSKPWNEAYHSWTASFQEKEPCALYCVSEEHVLSKLEAAAKDGTPCQHGTKNMCISGVCHVVGCDNVLESDSVEDRCGVCNGDGTQCKIVEETYKDVGQGYTKVVVIPAGARKIEIEENAPSDNIIAITDSSEKKFYLNGDQYAFGASGGVVCRNRITYFSTEDLDGECNIGTSVGIYAHVEPKKEKLIINGPLKEDIVLFVDFFEQNSPGYVYKWAEPSVDSAYEPRYHWEIGEFAECSVACGGGSQSAKIDCIEEKAGKVSVNFCAGLDRPKEQAKNCNEQPCKRTWKVGPWSQCRACENKGGVRSRHVECLEDNPKKGAEGILLEDDQCEGPKPGSVELCEAAEKCGHKRMISPYIPGRYQGQIWAQMNRKYPAKRNSAETHGQLNPESSNRSSSKSSPESSSKSKLGKMTHDFRPLDEEIIMKYTILPNPMKSHLSDKADALMGDALSDVIDTEHKMVFKGKVAAKMKHQLEHYTNTTLEFNCHKRKCIKSKSHKVKKNRKKPVKEDKEDDVADSDEEEN